MGVLGDVSTDRAEQESRESAMTAAADDEHDGAVAGIDEDLRGAALTDLHLEARRQLIAEDRGHGVLRDLLHVLGRAPAGWRCPGPAVAGGILPGGEDLNAGAAQPGDLGSPPQSLL